MPQLVDPPPIWEWLATQHNNTDPVRAAAARFVSERWQYGPWYNHRKVMSALQAEDSEHLHGMRLLQQDYVEFFDVAPEAQLHEQNLGAISPVVPVGREQCEHTFKSGRRCTRDAVPGAGKCGNHGGSWINEHERAEMVQRISERIVDLGERAVQTMAFLMDNAKSEKVRGDMALGLLDRMGVGPIQKLELTVTPKAEETAEEVKARLFSIRGGKVVPGEVTESHDEPAVDPPAAEGA